MLQNHSLVSDSPGYALPIQIFEEGNRKFPADSGQIFEFADTHFRILGLESFHVGNELVHSRPVDEHVFTDLDQRILFHHQLNDFSGGVAIQLEVGETHLVMELAIQADETVR